MVITGLIHGFQTVEARADIKSNLLMGGVSDDFSRSCKQCVGPGTMTDRR